MAVPKTSGRLVSAAQRHCAAASWLLLAFSLVPGCARAEPIETEHLFGFTIGSDVGEVGEKEVEGEVAEEKWVQDSGQGPGGA